MLTRPANAPAAPAPAPPARRPDRDAAAIEVGDDGIAADVTEYVYDGANHDNASGKSRKFYRIAVFGQTVVREWGRIGTKGQTKVERYHSPGAARGKAREYHDQRVHDKGYSVTWRGKVELPCIYALVGPEGRNAILAKEINAAVAAARGSDPYSAL